MAKLTTFLVAAFAVLVALTAPSLAGDPDMLQDFCVADYKSLDGREYIHLQYDCSILLYLHCYMHGCMMILELIS